MLPWQISVAGQLLRSSMHISLVSSLSLAGVTPPLTPLFRLAAEEVQKCSPGLGPGTLRVGLMDQLHLMTRETVAKGVHIREGRRPA